ncbi:hypothetical protein EJB05_34223 [Eragrostis curvula]|uniref:Uncharacterized protein n=1 Tax=Eragrostis curvula TaxID=38414 RepID=A0A5J9U4I1_9POAL|nr:hypothetical protein EJB05_34223 [Eragrostis curvula]
MAIARAQFRRPTTAAAAASMHISRRSSIHLPTNDAITSIKVLEEFIETVYLITIVLGFAHPRQILSKKVNLGNGCTIIPVACRGTSIKVLKKIKHGYIRDAAVSGVAHQSAERISRATSDREFVKMIRSPWMKD